MSTTRPRRFPYFARKLAPLLMVYLVYSITILRFELQYLGHDLTVSEDFQAVSSLFLGSLLALRMNTAHSKWLEARLQFGRLVSGSRVVATYIAGLPGLPAEEKAWAAEWIVCYPRALTAQLRTPSSPHAPSLLSAAFQARLVSWREKGWLDGWSWSSLARLGEDSLMIAGACERIRNSPLVRSYHIMVMLSITLYLAAAPLVLHNRVWTLPLVMAFAVFFFTLELLAADVDEPFGEGPDDLPLEMLCGSVQSTVEQIFSSDDTSTIPAR